MMKTKRTLLIVASAIVLVSLSACVVVPSTTAASACHLLNTAFDEAEMAPGWYDSTGEILERCGYKDARERAEFKTCMREKFNGDTRVCHGV